MPERPTEKDIASLHTALKTEWAARTKLDEQETDFYFGTHQIEVPDTKVLGMEPEALSMGVGAQTVRHIKSLFPFGEYIVTPQGIGKKARDEAEKLSSWLNAVFQALEEDCQEDTRDATDEDAIRLARGVTLTLPIFKRYTHEYGYPQQDDGEKDKDFNKRVDTWRQTAAIPISHRHIPAGQVLFSQSGKYGIVKAVIETYELGEDIARQWPDSALGKKLAEDAGGKAKKHLILTYLDDVWVVYMAAGKSGVGIGPVRFGGDVGEILDSWPHKMGVCPVALKAGETTSDPRIEYRFRSRLYDVMPLGIARDRLISRQLTQVKVQALSSPIVTTEIQGGGKAEGNAREITLSGGEPVVLFSGEKIQPPLQYPLQPEAESLEQKIVFEINRQTFADVIRGEGGKDQSGRSFRYQTQAAQSQYTTLGEHLADGDRRQAQMICRAVMALGEAVVVRRSTKEGIETLEATPEMVKDKLNDIHVDRSPQLPEEKGDDLDAMKKALDLGFAWEWAAEEMVGITEPAKRLDEGIVSRWMQDAGMAALQRDALRRADLLQQAEEGLLPSEVDMSGLPPGLQRALQAPPVQPGVGEMPGGAGPPPGGVPPPGGGVPPTQPPPTFIGQMP